MQTLNGRSLLSNDQNVPLTLEDAKTLYNLLQEPVLHDAKPSFSPARIKFKSRLNLKPTLQQSYDDSNEDIQDVLPMLIQPTILQQHQLSNKKKRRTTNNSRQPSPRFEPYTNPQIDAKQVS